MIVEILWECCFQFLDAYVAENWAENWKVGGKDMVADYWQTDKRRPLWEGVGFGCQSNL